MASRRPHVTRRWSTCTRPSGVGHGLGNLFTAWRNQTPLVVVAGQQARSIMPFEPFLYSAQATGFPKPYVKWSCEPARAEDVPAAVARAYYVAMQPPRGPTFVSVPVDDWDRLCEPIVSRTVSRVVAGDPDLLRWAAQALRSARRPGRIVERLQGADLIVVLGAPVFTYHREGFGPHIPPGAELIQLTDDPNAAAWAPVGTSIVTHLKQGIRALLGAELPRRRAQPGPFASAPHLDGASLTDSYLLQQIDFALHQGDFQKGHELPLAPKVTANAGLGRNFNIGTGLLGLHTDLRYQGRSKVSTARKSPSMIMRRVSSSTRARPTLSAPSSSMSSRYSVTI